MTGEHTVRDSAKTHDPQDRHHESEPSRHPIVLPRDVLQGDTSFAPKSAWKMDPLFRTPRCRPRGPVVRRGSGNGDVGNTSGMML
jgi:hypothetical protein